MKNLITLFLFFVSSYAFGQHRLDSFNNSATDLPNASKTCSTAANSMIASLPEFSDTSHKEHKADSSGVYEDLDSLPAFPGGEDAMISWLQNNIEYPIRAREAGWIGICYLKVTIDSTGKIINVVIDRSSGHKILDDASIAAVKKMPKWTPGYVKGKAVSVYSTIPINYSLTNSPNGTALYKYGQNKLTDSLTYFISKQYSPKKTQSINCTLWVDIDSSGKIYNVRYVSKFKGSEELKIAIINAVESTNKSWIISTNNGPNQLITFRLPIQLTIPGKKK